MVLRIASLLVSSLVWSSIVLAGPVGTQQNQPPLQAKGIKDTLIASKTTVSANPDPYGFKPLLANNTTVSTTVASENSSSAHSLTYTAEAHAMVTSLQKEYLKGYRETLTHMKVWGIPYFNRIDKILTDRSMPTQLKYLAVIE